MSGALPAAAAAAVLDRTWRLECARIVAVVARLTHDVALAEECAQEALIAALDHWPRDGLPDNPAAWLTTVAKHRALDLLRRQQRQAREHEALGADADALGVHVVPDIADALDARRADDIGDDLLRLIFIACHPLLAPEAQVALTLRLLGGLSTAEIARAFLQPEPTVAQRIVRAKRTLGEARVAFELPPADERAERLQAVLAVVYLVFNEGYAATSGDAPIRPALCGEALRLAGLLVTLQPAEPEVHGLQALLALQASRQAARTDAAGDPVRLADQDRGRWHAGRIAEGLAALGRAAALAEALGVEPGPYQLQAAIAAEHARAPRHEATDWAAIAARYAELEALAPSPVVRLNRAVAVAMADGPAAGLALLAPLRDDPRLAGYPWLPAAHGELLERAGRPAEAAAQFRQAAERCTQPREAEAMRRRAAALEAVLVDTPAAHAAGRRARPTAG